MKKEILDWLISDGCTISPDGDVRTKNGDYVTLATLEEDGVANVIYKHKLTQLESVNGATKGEHGGAVGIGFSEEEQRWYGFTHRGFGSFGIGYTALTHYAIVSAGYVPENFKCETLEDCKRCAIAMSDLLD